MRNDNNWFKLFALMAVAGVAKSLFGPPPVSRPIVTHVTESAKTALEKSRDSDG